MARPPQRSNIKPENPSNSIYKAQESANKTLPPYELLGKKMVNKGIITLSLDGKILFANKGFSKLIDMPIKEIIYSSIYQYIPKEKQNSFKDILNLKKTVLDYEFILSEKNDSKKIVVFSIVHFNENNGEKRVCVFIENISKIRKSELLLKEKIEYMSSHDTLTGLLNRAAFESKLTELINSSNSKFFSILKLELDRFELLYNALGHKNANTLLKILGANLSAGAEKNIQALARIGEYRFGFIFQNGKSLEPIMDKAKELLRIVKNPSYIKKQNIYVTASIGISLFPADGSNANALMKNAEAALLFSKEQGGNVFQFSSPYISADLSTKHEVENLMRQALEKNKFQLYYQPKVDLKTGKIVGLEALLRLKNEKGEFIPPKLLINIAEETDLIAPVGEWVLRTVCKDFFNGKNSMPVAVNLSIRQLERKYNLINYILKLREQFKIAPNQLELEVTETLMMGDPKHILEILAPLKKQGFQIAIDDFGTGYSSFAYLKHFTPNKVKIDKSFIDDIPNDSFSRKIVRSMILLSNSLGIETIAEGVETREQLNFLIDEGCDQIQGFYFSKPLPVTEIKALMARKEKLKFP